MRGAAPLDGLARLLVGAASAAMFAMMMVTVADVVLRSLFNYPIFGTFDLVELGLVTLIFLALPETFRREEHVAVDVIDHLAPVRVVVLLRALAAAIAVGYLALMLWHSVPRALDTYIFGDLTLGLGMPRFWHWIPILLGIAVAILVGLLVLLRNARAVRDARRRS